MNADTRPTRNMTGPRARFLDALLGFVFTRIVLGGAVIVTMWAFWNGHVLPALGMSLALAYFLYLYWQYVTVGGPPDG